MDISMNVCEIHRCIDANRARKVKPLLIFLQWNRFRTSRWSNAFFENRLFVDFINKGQKDAKDLKLSEMHTEVPKYVALYR